MQPEKYDTSTDSRRPTKEEIDALFDTVETNSFSKADIQERLDSEDVRN